MVAVSLFFPMEPTYCTLGWGHVLSRQYKMLLNTARPHNITGSQKRVDKARTPQSTLAKAKT